MIIHPLDNVEVRDDGHKYAIKNIAKNENIIKYGMPIGHATSDIQIGEHVHVHNVKTNLSGKLEYVYKPDFAQVKIENNVHFWGYQRVNGDVGIRNDLWIIPTVGCVNKLAEKLAKATNSLALTHDYGCSQLGEDHETTANLLAALAKHPNAGGVLIIGLGCENNTLESFKIRLGDVSNFNIAFMKAQDAGDEFAVGMKLLAELEEKKVKNRSLIPLAKLVVGLKCGGSDGLSGLTANPLVGRFSDWLVRHGGSSVLSEVPEMFGAETLLMNRCQNQKVFDKCVKMINDFKSYYELHNQVIYENPSPGNKAGGITTLEDKSLGCVQKGGSSMVVDVLNYGDKVKVAGLNLLTGPGNDLVASTVLAASNCHLILFTTGRGTPFGTVIPTVKVATNNTLAQNKPHWIDYDAQSNQDVNDFSNYILRVVNGEVLAKNELNQYQEIAIFKDGVTL